MKLKKDGRLVQARITPRVLKETTALDGSQKRAITVKQLAVLLYHYYITLDDPNIGSEDVEQSAPAFQSALNQEVVLDQGDLEKLLWHLQMAYESDMYWNPAEEEYDYFVKGLVGKNERFDKLYCLIMNKK
jgi:hypothetical protein